MSNQLTIPLGTDALAALRVFAAACRAGGRPGGWSCHADENQPPMMRRTPWLFAVSWLMEAALVVRLADGRVALTAAGWQVAETGTVAVEAFTKPGPAEPPDAPGRRP